MIGHDREQVVPGVDGVQSTPDDGEDDVDDDGADDGDDDVDDGDYVHCAVRTTLSNGCRTGCRARDRAGCSTTPGPSQTWRQVLGKECGLSLLIGCWLIVSHLGTDGWSPPVTLSRQRPGKPGRQQMA